MTSPIYARSHIYQYRWLAVAFTFCGGYIDAYTYGLRGNTLAAGQTGNIIFFSLELAQHNLPGLITKLLTFLAFVLGLVAVSYFRVHHRTHYWRIASLFPIIIICLVIGFVPTTWSNNLVVPPLAFGMAMLNLAFDKIEGAGYNNVFSTGNLKKAVIGWCSYFFEGDRDGLKAAINYTWLVSAFILGAVLSAEIQRVWGVATIWGASVFMTVVSGMYAFLLYRRNQYTKNPFYLASKKDDDHLN
ncbi:MAG: YoaK family protein [Limosilactobacillus gorillae]|jgi:uncharacterized membrane protein YoaK (UPF0700 family)|uniref:YoaK family protein n=1 Tax=Limosilactobacillus gorillae TaxID=1450649 RepID=UPI000B2D97F8|nr:YoaK family protein [Limosilactobacillus gorillae]MDO4855458.1 YoaK family protein [Limosilactobacillus gorillae]